VVKWIKQHNALLLTDTTFRDAHQSLYATRFRTYDMVNVSEATGKLAASLFSLEMWGGATFDVSMRFLKEDPWERLRILREKIPNVLFKDPLSESVVLVFQDMVYEINNFHGNDVTFLNTRSLGEGGTAERNVDVCGHEQARQQCHMKSHEPELPPQESFAGAHDRVREAADLREVDRSSEGRTRERHRDNHGGSSQREDESELSHYAFRARLSFAAALSRWCSGPRPSAPARLGHFRGRLTYRAGTRPCSNSAAVLPAPVHQNHALTSTSRRSSRVPKSASLPGQQHRVS
jgi:hypothetical protein